MLNLKSTTDPRWLATVESHLDDILLDHAHCEKKAAGTAMNLIFAYVDRVELVKEMTTIVNEELDHFRQVIDLIESRRHAVPAFDSEQLRRTAQRVDSQARAG